MWGHFRLLFSVIHEVSFMDNAVLMLDIEFVLTSQKEKNSPGFAYMTPGEPKSMSGNEVFLFLFFHDYDIPLFCEPDRSNFRQFPQDMPETWIL